MMNSRNLLILAIGLSSIVLLLTIGDAMALHDIGADYVSPTMVDSYELDPTGTLPAWSTTEGEWMVVNLSFFGRLAALIFILIILVRCLRLVGRPIESTLLSDG